jgi:hypothetical protein
MRALYHAGKMLEQAAFASRDLEQWNQVVVKFFCVWPMPLFILSTHKLVMYAYYVSHFIHNSTVSLKTLYPGGI